MKDFWRRIRRLWEDSIARDWSKERVARFKEARMDDRAVNRNSEATGKFSILDWPTPEMLQAANRARARAVCDMIVAFRKWAIAVIASHPISKSPRDASSSDAPRVAPKR